MQKPVRIPGPDHSIDIEPYPSRMRVCFNGKVIADTMRGLVLREAGYRPVVYIPREDANMSLLVRSGHSTYCPYKGDASYFSIEVGDRFAENAIWTYESPYDAVASIRNHLAFYPNRVDAIDGLPS
ncbi:MAG: DUF427 domain-containing protein [Bradyrhizobiaceae bacterium]|nr:DUF427 domain-containing protein [Bradyrhizobiaceae bacterium]